MGAIKLGQRQAAHSRSVLSLLSAYAAAVLLPCLALLITMNTPVFFRIPAALFLASIAVIASWGYTGPTVLGIVLSLALHNRYVSPSAGHWSFSPDALVREGVLFLVAAGIGFLNVRNRRAQLALARSESSYRTTLASIGDAVIAADIAGLVTFMNPIAEVLTGWSEGAAKGLPLEQIFRISDEKTGVTIEDPFAKVRRLREVTRIESHVQLERRDGAMVPIEDSLAPIRTADGQQAGFVVVFRDVTERREKEKEQAVLIERIKKAEEEERKALASYEEQAKALSLAQQAGKSAAWIMDVDKEEVRWLPGGFEIFGRPFAEFVGRIRPVSLVEPEDQPRILAAVQKTLETGAPFQPEYRIRWPNGEMHWQEARGVRDAENPRVLRGTTFDITERKNTELSLLRVEKLAAVGRIASTIAHEINNPLASITNLLYLALLEPSLLDPVRQYLQLAQQELSRLTNVTRLTLSYARPQTQPRRIDPAEVLESVLFLFRSQLGAKNIQVIRNVTEPVRITIFVDELQRIFTNLIANAIDAVGSRGGVLRIVLERQGSQVLLVIEDNGMGIPADRIDRIFDPFFTTKEEVGTGIGLWVTKELVEKNHGAISLRSGSFEDGMRTRCEVCFPLA